MKKFFGGGNGGGGGVALEPAIRSSPNGADPSNFHHQYQSNSSSLHNLAPPALNGALMTPAAIPLAAISTNSPRTPHFAPTNNQHYFDLQPTRTLSPTPSSSTTMLMGTGIMAPIQNIAQPPTTPGTVSQMPDPSNSSTNMQAHAVDRNDLHKGLKSLEGVLVTLDEYRELKSKLAKCEKKLAKNLVELGKSKALEDVPCQTLQASSLIFDSITDTTVKHAKLIQKEYEALNEHCARYFKKVAKEEKAHDELLDTLDSKVKKAHASHEKNVKKVGRNAIESHDRYIQSVQALTQEISRAKLSHSSSVGTKTFITSLVVASTLGGIADSEFKALCENVRKSGPHIGKLNEWLNFASTEGMTNMKPSDLSDDAMGWAQVLAIKEAEIREEYKKQERAKMAQLEHTQAMLKAQQMGWTPPSQQQQQQQQQQQSADSSLSPMSQKKASSEASTSANTSMTVSNLPRLDSQGQLIETNSKGDIRPSASRTVSIAERPTMSRSVSTASKGSAVEVAQAPRTSMPSTSTPNGKANWGIKEEDEEDEKKTHPQDESSIADGTVIDREETAKKGGKNDVSVKEDSKPSSPEISPSSSSSITPNTTSREDSDATTPSLSMSATNSKGSEDSNMAGLGRRSFGPATPTGDVPVQEVIITGSPNDRVEGILKKSDTVVEVKQKFEVQPPFERPMDRYVDVQAPKQAAPLVGRGNPENQYSLQRDDSLAERTRKLSLWEHEKERERQLERESELQRRLMDAEDRLRNMDREGQANNRGYHPQSAPVSSMAQRPRYSEPSRSYQQSNRYDEEIPAQRYEPEKYLPAVGTSRLSGVSVNRSMSTDSERSFVARMKARYQAEKEDQRDVGHSTPTLRQSQQQQLPTSPRKVSDMALAYSSASIKKNNPDNYGGYTYEPIASSAASRGRYESAPSRPTEDYHREVAHAVGCGCWACSARHYGGTGASVGMTKSKPSQQAHPPPPPPRHPAANPPPNNRRQSMPPVRDERSTLAAPLPPSSREIYARRSFEEESDRRVAFANTYQTIR